jgi:glyoxylase-like metal-dependent hydrolase (beta-lactamase superfamily II)
MSDVEIERAAEVNEAYAWTQAAETRTWQIGAVRVTKIVEDVTVGDIRNLFPEATTEAVLALPWLQPHFLTPEGQAILSIHAFIVDTPTKRIMVDTCVGDDKTRVWDFFDHLQNAFLNDLKAAGFARESFDVVLCTHLHVDHVGWNTMLVDGKWVPTFPKARYLLNKTEFEYWRKGEGVFEGGGWDEVQRQSFEDSVKPVVDAGLVDLVEGEHQVCDEVSLVPTVGHSPGHVSIRIRSGGEEALITGDMTHHPSQLAHPEWGLALDYDAAQARRTREQVFADAADRSVLVMGTHWAGDTAGKVVREGRAFRLKV